VDAGWAKRAAEVIKELMVVGDGPSEVNANESLCARWSAAVEEGHRVITGLRHAPADSASAQLTALTAERDAAQAEVGRLNDYLATRKLVEMFPGTFAALDDVAVRYVATLRRERDELRAELLTTHQMACRVGLERDELRAKQGEAP
jgi:hypothetical protein